MLCYVGEVPSEEGQTQKCTWYGLSQPIIFFIRNVRPRHLSALTHLLRHCTHAPIGRRRVDDCFLVVGCDRSGDDAHALGHVRLWFLRSSAWRTCNSDSSANGTEPRVCATRSQGFDEKRESEFPWLGWWRGQSPLLNVKGWLMYGLG